MPGFEITMQTITDRTVSVKAKDWQEAVSKACDRADRYRWETLSTLRVADENGNPIDTFKFG
tara:strand:- start:8944 stop:9129 length:186 start_codon:yes stop_codon:yes gene_type:complete